VKEENREKTQAEFSVNKRESPPTEGEKKSGGVIASEKGNVKTDCKTRKKSREGGGG